MPFVTGLATAPDRTHRLIPSRFPPVDTFETVTRPGDLEAVLELEGWTNDRLVASRLKRLPRSEWGPRAGLRQHRHGRVPCTGAPQGTRFAGPDLGAWYAASAFVTAVTEVAKRDPQGDRPQRPSAEDRGSARTTLARLDGFFVDIRGTRPDLHDPDPASYPVAQAFGRSVRAGPHAGIAYDSVRHSGGTNWVAYRPTRVLDVLQERACPSDRPADGQGPCEQAVAVGTFRHWSLAGRWSGGLFVHPEPVRDRACRGSRERGGIAGMRSLIT